MNSTPTRSSKRSATRGAVMVEYTFLLVAVGIPVLGGCIAGAAGLLSDYNVGREHILRSTP